MEVNKIKKSHEKSFFEWCEVKSPFFREAIQMHTSVRGEECAGYKSWCLANQIVLEQ